MEQYPDIKGTADFLVSPIMQTGMKEDVKRVHGLSQTKDLFTFDEGLADKQAKCCAEWLYYYLKK
jgi:hypothetical protein